MELDPKALEELLRIDPRSGPLTEVEEIAIPEPWPPISAQSVPQGPKVKRGPKPIEDWLHEIRSAWRHIDEEDKLAESWLASLPQVKD